MERFSPAAISPAEADWSRRLGLRRAFGFAFGNIRFDAAIGLPAPDPKGRVVRILAGESSLWLAVSDWDALIQRTAIGEGVTLAELPLDLAPALVEAATEPLLDALAKQSGVSWTVVEVLGPSEPPAPWRIGLELTDSDGGRLAVAVAALDNALPLLERLVETCPVVPQADAAGVPITMPVEIGMTTLAVHDLRSLRVRDVLLMDVTAFRPDRHAIIRTSRTTAWRVTVGEGQLTLVEPRTTAPVPPLPAGSPTVNIVFEFGAVVLTPGQIPRLAAGQTLPIEHAERIQLTIEGRPFARGELIEVTGRLGMRIVEMASVRP
jgi:type III secretion system YscQ/HrcQ family protein